VCNPDENTWSLSAGYQDGDGTFADIFSWITTPERTGTATCAFVQEEWEPKEESCGLWTFDFEFEEVE